MMADDRLYYVVTAAVVVIFTRFLIGLYKARRRMIRLKKQGLCMPPHHPLFGHLLVVYSILSKLPSDAHPLYLPDQLRRKYPDMGPVFYVDLWPFNTPILFANSPSAAYQLLQENSLLKGEAVGKFMYPLTKNNDLVTMEGRTWKEWRSIFNPAFSASHLITLVPSMLEAVSTYSKILTEHAESKNTFSLEQVTIGLTLTIIGIVTLGTPLNAQRSDDEFVSALREQLLCLPSESQANPFPSLNPVRFFARRYYNRRMDRYLSRELDHCFALQVEDENTAKGPKQNTIVSLALDRYIQKSQVPETRGKLNEAFKDFIICQLKGIILAGHGTTANTLCFIYYLLASNPSTLRRMREEHDTVFGVDVEQTSSTIVGEPHLLNQIPYTLAVIKETLRLYPADSSSRRGKAGISLSQDGQQYPTEGCEVWTLIQAIHRDARYWPQGDTFIPERWLCSKEDPLYPVKGAWRPFEFGPRNCIGQELSLLEMKLALVMTIRKFDFGARFDEWDQKHGTQGPRMVNGDSAYTTLHGTSRPRNGFPCRVTVAKG